MKLKIYSSEYMKASSKGQFWIPVLITIGFLMAFPVAELILLGNWSGMEYTMEQIERLYENLWRDGFMATGYVVVCAAAVINGVNGFWYLYSPRKIDFYHSLPVKRSGMFWDRSFIGIIYYLVPYVLMEFLAVCIGAMRGCFSLKLMGMALMMLVMHLILYLLLYFSTVLVICVTGNILMGGLVMTGTFLYSLILGTLIQYYRSAFYVTFESEKTYGLIKILKEYGSPFFIGKSFLGFYSEGTYGAPLAVVVVVTAILGILAFLAYVRRPSEAAGRPMIYPHVGIVVKYLIVIPCGLGVGLIFYVLPQESSRMVWWIFGMVLGTVFSHGIMEILYQMDFRKFLSKKRDLLIAGILVAVCAVFYQKDLLHFDTYLPDREKITALNVQLGSMNSESVTVIQKMENGRYDVNSSWDDPEMSLIEGTVGQMTYEALEELVNSQCSPGKSRNRGTGSMTDGWSYSVPVKYTLSSGREIYRCYQFSEKQIRKFQEAFLKESRLKELTYSFLEIENTCLKRVEGVFMNGSYTLFQNSEDMRLRLLEAFQKDVEEASAEALLEQPCAQLMFYYEIPVENGINSMVPGQNDSLGNIWEYAYVYPGFERTIAILEETGYSMNMEEVSLKRVTVTYWNAGENRSEVIEYDSREELEAFRKALVPGQLRVASCLYESAVDVLYEVNDFSGETYAYLKKEEVPDFVKEKIRENGENR